MEARIGHLKHPHLGDHQVHNVDGGDRQAALPEHLGVALVGMLHGHDHPPGAGEQVHGAAHAGHHFAGNHVVGDGAPLVHLHGSQHRHVHMAAPNDTKGGGAVKEDAPGQDGGMGAPGVHQVVVLQPLFRGRTHADEAVFRLEEHVAPLGHVVGHQGGQADAQVDNRTVGQLLGHPPGDEFLHLLFVHHASSSRTM